MLEVGLADDAGLAVGAAAVVRRVKAIDADGSHAAAGQLVERGAADAAGAEDDGVVRGHGASVRGESLGYTCGGGFGE